MPEDELGLEGIDIGDGTPRAVIEEDTSSDDGLKVRVPLQRGAEGLDDGDHAGPGIGFVHKGCDPCTRVEKIAARLAPAFAPATAGQAARWAESPTLTRESYEKLGAAPRANDAGENPPPPRSYGEPGRLEEQRPDSKSPQSR